MISNVIIIHVSVHGTVMTPNPGMRIWGRHRREVPIYKEKTYPNSLKKRVSEYLLTYYKQKNYPNFFLKKVQIYKKNYANLQNRGVRIYKKERELFLNKFSLVEIGTIEGDLVKRAAALIRPSSINQKRVSRQHSMHNNIALNKN